MTTPHATLCHTELTRALNAGLTLSGLDSLDLVGCDASLMNMIEVAQQVGKQTLPDCVAAPASST